MTPRSIESGTNISFGLRPKNTHQSEMLVKLLILLDSMRRSKGKRANESPIRPRLLKACRGGGATYILAPSKACQNVKPLMVDEHKRIVKQPISS